MRRFFVSAAVALLSSVLMLPVVDAQSRPGSRSGNGSSRSERTTSVSGSRRPERPQVGNRPGNGSSSGNLRPGNSGNHRPERPQVGNRPGNGSSSGNLRPGNSGNHRPDRPQVGNRPGNGSSSGNLRPGSSGNHRPDRPQVGNRPGNNRPHDPGYRPGASHRPVAPGYRPGATHRPGYRPAGRPVHRPGYYRPPVHPYRPVFRPFVRPVPPPGFRARYRTPLLSGFLGVTFGMSIANTVSALNAGGYAIDDYGTEEVYLRNVEQLGYYWDDATLHYSNGSLVRSVFYESTSYDYTQRYNNVFKTLTATYGAPVSSTSDGSGISASWFGYNGDYITLEYTLLDSSDGFRYFTILTYGN